MLVPIQTTPLEAASLADGEWTDAWVPPLANVHGGPVEIEVQWGTSQPPCSGYCPNRYASPPFAIQVFDCGSSPCAGDLTYPEVGSSDYSSFTAVEFSATPNHHYQIWAHLGLGAGGEMELQVSMVTPLFGAVAGLVLLAVGAAAIAYGVRAAGTPRPAWPAACRP